MEFVLQVQLQGLQERHLQFLLLIMELYDVLTMPQKAFGSSEIKGISFVFMVYVSTTIFYVSMAKMCFILIDKIILC